LLTALSFVGLFYLEVVENIGERPVFAAVQHQVAMSGGKRIDPLLVPVTGWGLLLYHMILLAFLIVTSFCDIDYLEIPLPVTVTGTVVGLVLGTLLWHWLPTEATLQTPLGFLGRANLQMKAGVYPWPVWTPLPAWLPAGSLWTGLATGCAGVLAGTLVLRAVRFVFGVGRGIEGLGVGDADLMMMAGAFLGWQPIVVAFFVAVFPALVFGILQLVFRGHQMLPFGPSLAIGIVITLLGWQSIGPRFADIFFNATLLLFLAGAGVVILLTASFLLRLLRR
jgi:leader peptidase (prepilin peptidase)/N-methyltransferase